MSHARPKHDAQEHRKGCHEEEGFHDKLVGESLPVSGGRRSPIGMHAARAERLAFERRFRLGVELLLSVSDGGSREVGYGKKGDWLVLETWRTDVKDDDAVELVDVLAEDARDDVKDVDEVVSAIASGGQRRQERIRIEGLAQGGGADEFKPVKLL